MLIRKKGVDEIDVTRLFEPRLTPRDLEALERGVDCFNEGHFWEAHECWEEVWRQRQEESRIFFQGIIQAAAGFHRIVEKPILGGAVNNLTKALAKLDLFPERFIGIDVKALRRTIVEAKRTLVSEGIDGARERLENHRVRIEFRKGGLIDTPDARRTRRRPTERGSR
jgi:uncharacterized protein